MPDPRSGKLTARPSGKFCIPIPMARFLHSFQQNTLRGRMIQGFYCETLFTICTVTTADDGRQKRGKLSKGNLQSHSTNYKSQLCSRLPFALRQADIVFQQFQQLLKTFLLRRWDRDTLWLTVTWFLPICQNQFQELYYQGPHAGYITRTKLTQTGTFISIYKQVQFTQDNLTLPNVNQKLELSEKFTKCINSCQWIQLRRTEFRMPTEQCQSLFTLFTWAVRSLLIWSRHFRKSNSSTFKDLQNLYSREFNVCFQGLSRPWKSVEIIPWLSTFKDLQQPCCQSCASWVFLVTVHNFYQD